MSVKELERCSACGSAVGVYEMVCANCGVDLRNEKRRVFRHMQKSGFVTPEALEVMEQLLDVGVAAEDEVVGRVRKQVTELTLEDLGDCPIWEFAIDEEGEPGQDEETVRPRSELTVVDPSDGLFLIAARFTTADGTVFSGWTTLNEEGDQADAPAIVTGQGETVYFAHGIAEPRRDDLDEAYRALAKTASELFPIRVEPLVPTRRGNIASELDGFTYVGDEGQPRVKR